MKIVDKIKTSIHGNHEEAANVNAETTATTSRSRHTVEYYENNVQYDRNYNKREKNYDPQSTSTFHNGQDLTKPSGLEYRKDLIERINTKEYTNAPMLDSNGLPFNIMSDAPTPVLLKRHLNSVERLMETRIFRERADANTKQVVYDIKNILNDLIVLCEQRKVDEHLNRILKDMKLFGGDMKDDREMKVLLEDWKTTFMRLATGDQSKGIISSSSKVLSDLKGSETVIRFFSEASKFLQMIVMDTDMAQIDVQREVVFEEFYKLARLISASPAWGDFVLNSKTLTQDIKVNEKAQSSSARTKIQGIQANPNYNSLNSNIKIFFQTFIKDKSVADVDKFFEYGNSTLDEMNKNPKYKLFVNDLQRMIRDLVENPDLVDDPSFRKAIRDLYNRGESLIVETKNSPNLQKFTSEGARIKQGIAADELNSLLFNHVRQLIKDLNPPGKGVNYNLYGQLRMLLVPFLIEEFRTIPLPPISGVTPDRKLGYRVGNVNLSAIELLPENIHFEISHKTNADPYTLSIIDPDTIIWVELTAIRAHIEKVSWEYDRFVFPKLRDAGLADIYLDGRGARVGVELRLLRHGTDRKIQVLDSYCILDNLKIRLYNCKHRLLYKFITRMLRKTVKFQIEKAVATMIAKKIAEYDFKLTQKYNIAKINRQKARAKLGQKLSGLKSKKQTKSSGNKKKSLADFFKTVIGTKNYSDNTINDNMEIPATTEIPLTKKKQVVTERVITETVPVTTIPNSELPAVNQSTQYVVDPDANIGKEIFTKEKPSTPTTEQRPHFVGPSSN